MSEQLLDELPPNVPVRLTLLIPALFVQHHKAIQRNKQNKVSQVKNPPHLEDGLTQHFVEICGSQGMNCNTVW